MVHSVGSVENFQSPLAHGIPCIAGKVLFADDPRALLAIKNGIIDVATRELVSHSGVVISVVKSARRVE